MARIGRIWLLVGALVVLGQTCASAETWVSAGQLQYDTDSVYVGASDGLVYFTVCMEDKCVAGTEPMVMYMRYDCDAGTESNMEAFSDHWIDAVARTGALESALCARRSSLPRRQ